VTITGLASDLSLFNGGSYTSATGTWTGTAAQFDALTFNAGEDGTFNLSISATTTGAEAATTTSSYTLTVNEPLLTLSTPAFTGTAREGQVLSLSTAAVSSEPAETTITYQWQSSTNGFSTFTTVGTGTSYLVKEGDEGTQIRLVATATDADGNPIVTTATSTATAAVTDAAPTVTTPTITGSAQEGDTLTASASSGQLDNPVTYQWYDNGTAISGATASTYVVRESDEGNTLTVVATATNGNSVTTSATSAATAKVADAAATLLVTVNGTAREGQILTAIGVANSADATVNYQWQVLNGATWANIGGATSATYTVTEADENHELRVIATSSDADGSGTTATSIATAAVTDAPPALAVTVSGTAQEGKVLTATATPTSDTDGGTITYQWQELVGSNWGAVAGATHSTYTVAEATEGLQLRVVTTFRDDTGQTTSATSVATSAVLDAAPTVTTPTISGTAREGSTLTASATAGQTDNTVTYQWMENTGPGGSYQAIAGATGATYTIQEGDEALRIEVTATVINTGGTVSKTSAATAAVVEPAPTLTSKIPNNALNLPKGGTAALQISVQGVDADDNVNVTITGLTSYEYITYAGSTTRIGNGVPLTAAQVNSGLTLHSTYTGTGKPMNTLSIIASNTTTGETSTSAPLKITVTDPPPSSGGSSTITGAGGGIDPAGVGFSPNTTPNIALLGHYMVSTFASANTGPGGGLITDPSLGLSSQQQLTQPHHA
jgi:hypothetical protein